MGIGTLFGWKKTADHYRRFRTAHLEVARKNGKSTLVAGIGLYLLVADNEPGAEIYSAATKRDQVLHLILGVPGGSEAGRRFDVPTGAIGTLISSLGNAIYLTDTTAQSRIREIVLEAYAEFEERDEATA